MQQMPLLFTTGSDAMYHHGQDCKNSVSDEAEEDDEEFTKDGDDNSTSD